MIATEITLAALATEITLAALAAGDAVDIWLRSDLLATARAKIEARGGWLAELARCRFCLAFHAAWLAALLIVHLGPPGRALAMILAIHRLTRIIHGLFGAEDEPAVEDDVEEVAEEAWSKVRSRMPATQWLRQAWGVDPTPSSQPAGASKDASVVAGSD